MGSTGSTGATGSVGSTGATGQVGPTTASLQITNTTVSSGCTSGALTVSGGVGVVGDLNVCGYINANAGLAAVTGASLKNFKLAGQTIIDASGTNLAVGFGAGPVANGSSNVFVGVSAGALIGTGTQNVALGAYALQTNGTGAGSVAIGANALQISIGSPNTAVGNGALSLNTTGSNNVAIGNIALSSNTIGDQNSAVGGNGTLRDNTSGRLNTALGFIALQSNTTGSENTAVGVGALATNTQGINNTAVGSVALNKLTGAGTNANIAIGQAAGFNLTTGFQNIYIGNQGVASENATIRLGTVGTHTACFVAGISGSTSTGGVAVLVNAAGQLGTTSSSIRYKENVEDLPDPSEQLLQLRPVIFNYNFDDAKQKQYGLIAEEVAQIYPELVVNDAEGRIYTVNYMTLIPILLAEVQNLKRENISQQQQIEQLKEVCTLLQSNHC